MQNKNGSIVFMLVMIIITLTAIFYSSLRTNSYFISIVQSREQYEKQYQLLRALEQFSLDNYGQQIKDFGTSTQHTMPEKVLYKGSWPEKASQYEGKVWITQEKGISVMPVIVYISLLRKGRSVGQLHNKYCVKN